MHRDDASRFASKSRHLFSLFDLSPKHPDPECALLPPRGITQSIPVDAEEERQGTSLHITAFFHHLDHLSRGAVSAPAAGVRGKVKWSENRRMALARDGYRCRNPDCQRTGPLTVHHIHPRGLGGGHQISNLVTLCESCHQNLCTRCLRPVHLRVALGDAAMKFPNVLTCGERLPVLYKREEKETAVLAE